MQVNKVDTSAINNIYSKPAKHSDGKVQNAKKAPTGSTLVNIDLNEYIEKERKMGDVDMQKVARAKEMLNSGLLDDEKYIDEAARKMIKWGF